MPTDAEVVMGWDIGGAHLKAVTLDGDGGVVRCVQSPCPLWQGLRHLEQGIERIISGSSATHHAVTMTGELVDLFANRSEGVIAISDLAQKKLKEKAVMIFAGEKGFVSTEDCMNQTENIASMNWYATGALVASQVKQALLVDFGSTTTDIMLLSDGHVHAQGKNDFTRMASEELVYTGLVRTPLMALAQKVSFQNTKIGLMAEYFATTADVYRVLGELPEQADQHPAADNGDKTISDSARRMARMIGRDVETASQAEWRKLAQSFADIQTQILFKACERQLARGVIGDDAPLIGAGCGSFLARKLAQKLRRNYFDFSSFVVGNLGAIKGVNTCAPAYSVAALAYMEIYQHKMRHA
ncbi:MAG: hydantoinase/oxoprolinase family protein [Burkholderiales bacterium]